MSDTNTTTAAKINRIDFKIILSVDNANPNGDPLAGNLPRQNLDGYGEMTDVCLKRKIRDRLQELVLEKANESSRSRILCQANERLDDGCTSLETRFESWKKAFAEDIAPTDVLLASAIDARLFGALLAFKGEQKSEGKANKPKGRGRAKSKETEDADSDAENESEASNDKNSVSVGIKGAVTIGFATSVEPVQVTSYQITKSYNSQDTKDGKRGSDTMGMKHVVSHGIYVASGSINGYMAAKNRVTREDVDLFVEALTKLFVNDESAARPAGSMSVLSVVTVEHTDSMGGHYPMRDILKGIQVGADGQVTLNGVLGAKNDKITVDQKTGW